MVTYEESVKRLENIQNRFLDVHREETSLYVLLDMDDIEAIDNAIKTLKIVDSIPINPRPLTKEEENHFESHGIICELLFKEGK